EKSWSRCKTGGDCPLFCRSLRTKAIMVVLVPFWRRLIATAWLLWLITPVGSAHALEFHLTFDPTVTRQPFTGRVYVMLFANEVKTLQPGPNWFKPEPFFARDVRDWKPGETLTLGAEALSYPLPLSKVRPGRYSIQAVMDFRRGQSFS